MWRKLVPWLFAAPLLALLVAEAWFLLTLPAPGDRAPLVIPLRPPLTRPAPAEALLIADNPPPVFGSKEARERISQLSHQAALLRLALAEDGYALGAALSSDQLLYILSQRDRLVRDRYEGRWYAELAQTLARAVQP